jgi:hypothetical protein
MPVSDGKTAFFPDGVALPPPPTSPSFTSPSAQPAHASSSFSGGPAWSARSVERPYAADRADARLSSTEPMRARRVLAVGWVFALAALAGFVIVIAVSLAMRASG